MGKKEEMRQAGLERTKLKVRTVVSGAVLVASFAILLGDYPAAPREWAVGGVALVLAYWLR